MSATLPIVRSVLLFSIVSSAAVLADDVFDTRPFCGFESDCQAVTGTEFGRPLGVPLSAVGLAGFVVLFTLTLFPGARSFALVAPLAVAAGCVGIGLIGVQAFVLERFCPLCLLVDGTAAAAAVLALRGRVWREAGSNPSRRAQAGWAALALSAAGGPFLLGWARGDPEEPPVPPQVAAHWVEGAVALVEVTDFECPACRRAEPVLTEFRREHPELRFVRLVAPIPTHANARPAGRAFLAARAQGRGEEMAVLLMAADSRAPDHCRQLAARLGLNLVEYDRAVSAPATDAELNETAAWVRTAGTGLPLVWVQGVRIQGIPTPELLARALNRVRSDQ
jgi:uncharacterized membrane protein